MRIIIDILQDKKRSLIDWVLRKEKEVEDLSAIGEIYLNKECKSISLHLNDDNNTTFTIEESDLIQLLEGK